MTGGDGATESSPTLDEMRREHPATPETPRPTASEAGGGWGGTQIVAGVFGLLAGLVALVYVFGGIILLLRLQMRGLRAEVVVATLPREFLVSVGLAVLLQLIVVVAFLLIPAVGLALGAWFKRTLVNVAAILGTLALAYPLFRWIGWEWWLVGAVVAALGLLVVLYRALHAIYRPDAVTTRTIGLVLVLALLAFLPWRVALEWFALEGLDVTVCTTGATETQQGTALRGLFIGENETSVYVGEDREESPRIVEIPRSEIERVFLGKGADDIDCGVVP